MESLFLSPASEGRRVYLYAVPDGVPLYFKHTELMQQPDYQLLWRGNPSLITEHEAVQLVAQLPSTPTLYRDYQRLADATAGFDTAKASFHSAVQRLGQQLEYPTGTCPTEVLVGALPG